MPQMTRDRCTCKAAVLLGMYSDKFYQVKFRRNIDVRVILPAIIVVKCDMCGHDHIRRFELDENNVLKLLTEK